MKHLKIDTFVLAIIATVAFAYFVPQLEHQLPLDLIGSIGVSLIFFFYGLKLSPEKIKSGLKNWKLHVLVQSSTFLLFPLVVLLFYPVAQTEEAQQLWLSFLFLAALPSTVSSSVVMVSMAKGNIPAAIFNASISGLIGIAVTPLWMGLFLQNEAADFSLGHIYLKLITEILIPICLGFLLQRFWGKYTQRYSRQLVVFDRFVILLIIYKSFAESFEEGIFQAVSLIDLLLILVAILVLFFLIYNLIGWISGKMGFNYEDRVTAQFCGTKKSVVHGAVFAKILFPAAFPIGIVLLPLMLFHAIQIFIISIIASRLGREIR